LPSNIGADLCRRGGEVAALDPKPQEAADTDTRPPAPEPDFTSGSPQNEGLKAGAELAKQLITLSVGMIALTITFLKDIAQPETVAHSARTVSCWMMTAWVFYVLCILVALATLTGICGTLTVLDRLAMKLEIKPSHRGFYDVYGSNIAIPMGAMQVSFLIAVVFTVIAAAVR